jgi:hypothetical protein
LSEQDSTVAGRGKISEPSRVGIQIWTGGALNIIKLIRMNSTFAQILGKLIKDKMFENLKNF